MTTRIRCKLICHGIWPHEYTNESNPLSKVRFGAVYSPDTGNPDDENAVFGKATPFGEFNLTMATPVAEKLEQGKAYYVDITPAE
ncbi:hypothetical protein [Pseudomonas moorei]|uniref:hypothetical protein n=1 Tax=Pseudomonas moorei TaxID=395599 RepID=UPI0036F2EAD2